MVEKEKKNNLITIREHLAKDIDSIMKGYTQYINISAEIIATNAWTDDELTRYVTKLADSSSVIESVYYGDKDRKIINSDNWKPDDSYDIRTRLWYTDAIAKNNLVISGIYTDARTGGTIISISKPVYNDNGIFMGVVSSDITLQEIVKLVERTKVQGSGYSFLIDGTGNILAHPKYKYNIGSGLININDLSHGIHDRIQSMKMGQIEVSLDGHEGYLTYKPVANTDWTIGNFVSLKDFKGGNSDIWRMFFIAVTISIIIFFSFTSMQRKSFLIPLLKLDEDIRNINLEDNIQYRIPVESKDPFRKIKETLNVTLGKAQDLVEQVEKDKENISKQNKELNYLSYNDQLTGLYNRRYFEENLTKLDVKSNLPISIIMGDANGLKLINDSFGHKIGDNLLVNIAKLITKGCRVDDIVARISGDEFVIILLKTQKEEAQLVVKRIQDLSRGKKIIINGFEGIGISVSYGVATKENMQSDIKEILKIAEERMYSNKILEGPSMRRKTIKVITEELYAKDIDKKRHSKNVSNICEKIGIELGLDRELLKELVEAAKVHDIGEISIKRSIINKKDKLTEKEWLEIKRHPEIGYRILNTVEEMSNIAYYTLCHHERYDGKGYPKGLKADEIPLASRIISIANAYDAMSVDRPYRKALNKNEIVKEFTDNSGTQFDPEITEVFIHKVLPVIV